MTRSMELNEELENQLDRVARPLVNATDLDDLIEQVKDRQVVMLGEATHGTSEFYTRRADISRILIEDYGFKFIAVEGDYPDSQRVNNYIKGQSDRSTALQVLLDNHRWPTWMWANQETALFIEWLKKRNSRFFGLDVYSFFESIEESVSYVKTHYPDLVPLALELSRCFDPFHEEEKAYARSLPHLPQGCAKEIIGLLSALRSKRLQNVTDEHLDAIQNAYIMKNAERYYRSLVFQDEESWNIRDRHMMDTLTRLINRLGPGIVWAHNTHIGDYRATPMKDVGLVNLGGLAREEFGAENVALIGFGTYQGSVMASRAWGGQEKVMTLPPAREGSYEKVLHDYSRLKGWDEFYVLLQGEQGSALDTEAGHRAVGVVYQAPESRSQFVPTRLASRYDAFVFVDRSSALNSLYAAEEREQIPETFPSGQ